MAEAETAFDTKGFHGQPLHRKGRNGGAKSAMQLLLRMDYFGSAIRNDASMRFSRLHCALCGEAVSQFHA